MKVEGNELDFYFNGNYVIGLGMILFCALWDRIAEGLFLRHHPGWNLWQLLWMGFWVGWLIWTRYYQKYYGK